MQLPIYAPNISKTSLERLLEVQLGDKFGLISVRQVKTNKYRGPQLEILLFDMTNEFLLFVIEQVLISARMLGGSMFLLRTDAFEMNQRPINIDKQRLANLFVATTGHGIDQIDIF